MNRQTPRPPLPAERAGDYRPDPRPDPGPGPWSGSEVRKAWRFTDWAAI